MHENTPRRHKLLVCQHVPHEILGTLNPLLKAAGFRLRYVNFGRHPQAEPDIDEPEQIEPAEAALQSSPAAEGAEALDGEVGSAAPAGRQQTTTRASRQRYRPRPCCFFGPRSHCE